jgi:hypothetical protein
METITQLPQTYEELQSLMLDLTNKLNIINQVINLPVEDRVKLFIPPAPKSNAKHTNDRSKAYYQANAEKIKERRLAKKLAQSIETKEIK